MAVAFEASVEYETLFSGALPSPRYFSEYPKDVQERICRWNDAYTIDESRRQDRLVESEIRQQNRASLMTLGIMVLFAILAAACFLATENAASFLFLSVPVMNSVANMIKPAFSKSSRSS